VIHTVTSLDVLLQVRQLRECLLGLAEGTHVLAQALVNGAHVSAQIGAFAERLFARRTNVIANLVVHLGLMATQMSCDTKKASDDRKGN
jgi:hypothetical protein